MVYETKGRRFESSQARQQLTVTCQWYVTEDSKERTELSEGARGSAANEVRRKSESSQARQRLTAICLWHVVKK